MLFRALRHADERHVSPELLACISAIEIAPLILAQFFGDARADLLADVFAKLGGFFATAGGLIAAIGWIASGQVGVLAGLGRRGRRVEAVCLPGCCREPLRRAHCRAPLRFRTVQG